MINKILIIMILILAAEIIIGYMQYSNSTYYKQKKTNFIKIFFDKGAFGEYRTSTKLEKIDKDAKFLFNVYIPKKNEFTEIDIIYINPKGIFVVENKNYSGWIFGKDTDNKWCQSLNNKTKYFFYNPIKQNETHIKYLKETLEKENINIEQLHSIISFNNGAELKKIVNNTNSIVTNSRYISYIVKNMIKYTGDFIDTNMIYEKLEKYTKVTEEQKIDHVKNIKKQIK